MYHWLSRRFKTHVKICVLALMIERIAERTWGQPWSKIARTLHKLQATKFFNSNHREYLRKENPADTRNILIRGILAPPAARPPGKTSPQNSQKAQTHDEYHSVCRIPARHRFTRLYVYETKTPEEVLVMSADTNGGG
jgi:hypothetical protein